MQCDFYTSTQHEFVVSYMLRHHFRTTRSLISTGLGGCVFFHLVLQPSLSSSESGVAFQFLSWAGGYHTSLHRYDRMTDDKEWHRSLSVCLPACLPVDSAQFCLVKGVEESCYKAVISTRVAVWLGFQWTGMSVGPQEATLITKIRKIKNEEGAVDRAVAPLLLMKGKGYSLVIFRSNLCSMIFNITRM